MSDGMKLRPTALRFVIAICLNGALLLACGEALMQPLLGPLGALIDLIDPQHRVVDLSIARKGADTVVRLEAGIRRMVLTGHHVTFADPRARAVVTTPLAAFWLAPSMLLALLAAWPVRRASEWPLRALCALPVLALLLAVDAPFVLDAELWALHRDAHAPDSSSAMLAWSSFMKSGGRFVLAGLLALALVAWVQRAAGGRRAVRSDHPA